MNSFQLLIITSLIYTTFAGGPTIHPSLIPTMDSSGSILIPSELSSFFCAFCFDVLTKPEAPSDPDCIPLYTKVMITVTLKDGTVTSGACSVNAFTGVIKPIHPTIKSFSANPGLEIESNGAIFTTSSYSV
ncbi:hypothetical protein ACKWTF_014699 [Chironomus riparius]